MTLRKAAIAVFIVGAAGLIGCAATSKTDAPAKSETQTAPAPSAKPAAAASSQTPADSVVHFAFDSSALDGANRNIVDTYGRYLASNPRIKIKVEGHADERGTRAYNLALGERRARSVAQALSAIGVAANRISVVSYGEDRPVAQGRTEQAWAKNRRGVIIQ